jgi:hypothetical protein
MSTSTADRRPTDETRPDFGRDVKPLSDGLSESKPALSRLDCTGRSIGLYSLRHRLPLLIFAVLATIGGTFAWLAYREVQQALRVSGTERAAGAAGQVSELLAQSITARVAELRRLAANPEVQQAVRSRNADAGSVLPPVLSEYLRRNQQSTIALYDATGTRIAPFARECERYRADARGSGRASYCEPRGRRPRRR